MLGRSPFRLWDTHRASLFRLGIVLATAVFIVFLGCGSDLGPQISSEDFDLDTGGNEPGNRNNRGNNPSGSRQNCTAAQYPQKFTLKIKEIVNGSAEQVGENSPTNPLILYIGNIRGPDPSEPQTQINLEFVTNSTTYIVGPEPNLYPVFLHLILFDLSQSQVFQTTYIQNEKYYDKNNKWVGNRIAEWIDQLYLFDGILNLDQTYILQSCQGFLMDPVTRQPIPASSQPLYIRAEFGPPKNDRLPAVKGRQLIAG